MAVEDACDSQLFLPITNIFHRHELLYKCFSVGGKPSTSEVSMHLVVRWRWKMPVKPTNAPTTLHEQGFHASGCQPGVWKELTITRIFHCHQLLSSFSGVDGFHKHIPPPRVSIELLGRSCEALDEQGFHPSGCQPGAHKPCSSSASHQRPSISIGARGGGSQPSAWKPCSSRASHQRRRNSI